MQERLDLVKILKDCPKGMPLDCEIFNGTVTFSRIVNDEQYPIEIKIDDDYIEYLNKYGSYVDRSFCKCVVFPKGKTTWEGFHRPFIDGDIVTYDDQMAIFKKYINIDDDLAECYVFFDSDLEMDIDGNYYVKDLATEEEKAKLFKALKDKGYKWDSETKTLEKLIVPKFKVGDTIRHQRDLSKPKNIITEIRDTDYVLDNERSLPFTCQESYELVPKFNPKTLKPFDKVLVADSLHQGWCAVFLSHIDEENKTHPFIAGIGQYRYCIPYNNDTKHLAGKSGKAPEFYRYWEE